MQNFIEKHEELIVFNKHTCRHVCSSVKGRLEEETSVGAMNFNLLFPFILPFFPVYHLVFFSSSLSSMGEGERRH